MLDEQGETKEIHRNLNEAWRTLTGAVSERRAQVAAWSEQLTLLRSNLQKDFSWLKQLRSRIDGERDSEQTAAILRDWREVGMKIDGRVRVGENLVSQVPGPESQPVKSQLRNSKVYQEISKSS